MRGLEVIGRFFSLGILVVLATVPAQAELTVPEGVLDAGNDYYRVRVNDVIPMDERSSYSYEVGIYTAITGPLHPAGEGLSVLYGAGWPGTTFNTVRSYTTGTDYVQYGAPSFEGNPSIVNLDPYGEVTFLGDTGIRTTYTLPGPPETPDKMTIVSDVEVHGTTYRDSSIEVKTTLFNESGEPLSAGLRYLWDFQIGSPYDAYGDDGPTFQPLFPDGPILLGEKEFVLPFFESYRIVDNDVNPAPPTFFILGTVTGPDYLGPTPPDLLQFTAWPYSSETSFDYLTDTSLDISTGDMGINDCAVLYFFGHDQGSALSILPGESGSVSASLFLTRPVFEVSLDIKPGSCDNPMNQGAKGVFPAALMGAEGFDPFEVDPASLSLEGVVPFRWSYGDEGTAGACGTGKDGREDLLLKFDNLALSKAVERVLGRKPVNGEVVELTLSGSLKAEYGAVPIEAVDKVKVIVAKTNKISPMSKVQGPKVQEPKSKEKKK